MATDFTNAFYDAYKSQLPQAGGGSGSWFSNLLQDPRVWMGLGKAGASIGAGNPVAEGLGNFAFGMGQSNIADKARRASQQRQDSLMKLVYGFLTGSEKMTPSEEGGMTKMGIAANKGGRPKVTMEFTPADAENQLANTVQNRIAEAVPRTSTAQTYGLDDFSLPR